MQRTDSVWNVESSPSTHLLRRDTPSQIEVALNQHELNMRSESNKAIRKRNKSRFIDLKRHADQSNNFVLSNTKLQNSFHFYHEHILNLKKWKDMQAQAIEQNRQDLVNRIGAIIKKYENISEGFELSPEEYEMILKSLRSMNVSSSTRLP